MSGEAETNEPPSRARIVARGLIVLAVFLLIGFGWTLGRPLYWRMYATVIRPFVDADEAGVGAAPDPGYEQLSAAVAGINADDPKFKLTRELAQQQAKDGYLMVTWANRHYLDFAITWVAHVQRQGMGFLVGALDDELLAELEARDVPTFRMNAGLSKDDFGWGSKQFHEMGKWKIRLIQQVLELGVDIIISDIDTVWLQDPTPFFAKFPEADVLCSSDMLHTTATEEGTLEAYPEGAGPAANIGIMMFRAGAMPLVRQWVRLMDSKDIWDQAAFNDIFRMGMSGDPDHPKRLFKAFNGNATMGILPVGLFASGHTYFVQRMHETLGHLPYVAHATFQFSGTSGKRHRFREDQLFEDPPSHFTHPKGFILVQLDVPRALLDAARPPNRDASLQSARGHLDLVHQQLLQLRPALAVASITGRAIIMPPLWCGQDKYWGVHTGTLPGSDFQLPFQCPMDHIMDMEGGWDRPWPAAEYGPHIDYREHSFLTNPQAPDDLTSSVVNITICAQAGDGCGDAATPAEIKDGAAALAPGLSTDDFLAATKNLGNVSVWHLVQPLATLGDWSSPEDFKKFQRRLSQYTTTFCCADHDPGHVWYDFWFDQPHKDRFGRQMDVPWAPRFGDQRRRRLLAGAAGRRGGVQDGGLAALRARRASVGGL